MKYAISLFIIILFLATCIPLSSTSQNADPSLTELEFNTAVKKGDQYYSEGKYDRALYEFETARKLKPGDKYPQERIKVINEILDDQKTKNILFEVAVTSAEKWYKAGDYRKAKAEFDNALRIDPTAQYPKDRLAQINKIWSDPEVDARYAAAILHADDLFAQKRYLEAKAEYIVASDLKPYEQYPLDRIIAINEILAKLQLQQDQYNAIIAKADGHFDKKEYTPARSTYQDASNIKPDEVYPKDRIREIDAILDKLKSEREAYDRIIAMADEYYMNRDFEKARIEYEKAIAMKPAESYAKNMIARIDPQIAEMQRVQSEYDLTMTNANTLLQKNDYQGARELYQKAGKLKPGEALPTDKIAEIDRILDELAVQNEREKQFGGVIKTADSLFSLNNLEASRSFFVKALGIFPDRSYPKEKIAEIESLLASQKTKEEYLSVIAEADKLFLAKQYEGALASYEKAKEIKPGETYPQVKIDEINGLLIDLKAMEDSYTQAIQEGDRLFTATDYAGARTSYQKASDIKPAEAYPKTKIAEIDKILSEIAQVQQEYDKAIAAADAYYGKSDLANARLKYVAASDLKSQEQYPRERIALIDKTLADKEALEKGYGDAIAQADDFFAKKDYPSSKAAYQQALSVKPTEKYPLDRIAEIDRILAVIAASEMAYQEAIKAADAFFAEKNYPSAIPEYQKAQKAKPEEPYPGEQIAKINQILADIKATEEGYKNAIAEADKLFLAKQYEGALASYQKAKEIKPGETYPQAKIDEINGLLNDLKAMEDSYAQTIQEGDRLFTATDYAGARTSYQKASGIKPAEAYPKTKIAEIDKILAEIARVQQEYDKAIAAADAYYGKSDLANARLKYVAASDLKSQEQYPRERIALIDKTLADKEALEKGYGDAIAQADDFFAKKDYPSSKAAYQQALSVKPTEKYPLDRIAEIDRILAVIAASEMAYQEAIKAADAFFAEKNYPSAIPEYQKAQKAKPEEPYPGEQIAKINQILADIKATEEGYKNAIAEADKLFLAKQYEGALASYQKAKEIKPGETYPQAKIDEINGLLNDLKAMEDSYAQTIQEGDRLFTATDYAGARTSYQKASGIKPAEAYPKTKIAEIDKILAEIARIQKEYELAIQNADRYFTDKDYDRALTDYQKAQGLKPAESYPPEQISRINQILEEIKNIENAYTAHISAGDGLFAKKEYTDALTEYQQALALKSGELYPKNKVSEIEAILEALQAKKKAYDDAVVKADGFFNAKDYEKARQFYQDALVHDPAQSYPAEQIERINTLVKELEVQKMYDATVAKADQSFNAKDYDNALTDYQKAINIKSGESYPQSKINEINSILAANERARRESYTKAIEAGDSFFSLQDYKSARVQYQNAISIDPAQSYPKERLKEVEQILLDREMALKKAYQEAVAKADNLYTQKILDEAIDAYMAAHETKNDEVYPLNMINQIKKYIADHAIVDILNSSVVISNNTERKFDFTPVDIRQRKNNYIVMKARVLSETKPKVYLNYGRESARSGGIVLKSIKDNELNDYIIRVSAQDPWYRIDNSWLKLYSEGGDIEVTYIQISTAD
ncbi:MAG: hypothetical protein KBB71_02675 [Lentimicrobiaceae bacterium]|nr:hypothetical protein [Lentimicrobiaceae bacterium]